MIDSPDLDFSFSGLKTAVRYALEKHGKLGPDEMKGLAREVEDAITEVIIAKLERALDAYVYQSLIAGGGVIANATIRQALADFAESHSLALYLPQVDHSTDNALMISIAGYFKYSKNHSVPADFPATGGLSISSK